MPRKSTSKSSAKKQREAAERGTRIHEEFWRGGVFKVGYLEPYSEIHNLCDEYLDCEQKVKELKCDCVYENGTVTVRWSWGEDDYKSRIDEITGYSLETRMAEIKEQVGEAAIEHRREIKKLQSRCDDYEKFMQATMKKHSDMSYRLWVAVWSGGIAFVYILCDVLYSVFA